MEEQEFAELMRKRSKEFMKMQQERIKALHDENVARGRTKKHFGGKQLSSSKHRFFNASS